MNTEISFPPVEHAQPDGILAIGGDLSPKTLELAYYSGIFPWYDEDEPILWWSPDPRYVLFPSKLHVSTSMKKLIRKPTYTFKVNKAFPQVINACRKQYRPGQGGTWIGQDIENAYNELHNLGLAHSAECWLEDELVGGVYGILLDKVFCGESMFSKCTNASKFAFINYVQLLQTQGIQLIDCQVHTDHLESLGAEYMPRKTFLTYLK